MPKLQRFQASNDVQVVRLAPKINKETLGGDQGLGALADAAHSVGQAAQAWEDAAEYSEFINASTESEKHLGSILDDVKKEHEFKKFDDFNNKKDYYYNKIDEYRAKILDNITSNNVRNSFEELFEKDARITGANIEKELNRKGINWTKGKLVEKEATTREYVITAPEDNLRQDRREEYVLFLDQARKSGFLTDEQVNKSQLKMLDWEKDRAIYDAENSGASYVLDNMDDYVIPKSREQGLKKDLLNIAKNQEVETEIRILDSQRQNRALFEESIDNGDLTLSQQISSLDQAIDEGTMDKKWAKQRKAAILSNAGIDDDKRNNYFREVLESLNGATSMYGKEESSKASREYLKSIRDIEISIQKGKASGLLDLQDVKRLQTMIEDQTTSLAVNRIGKDAWSPLKFGYNDALKNFKNKLSTTSDVNRAMREYYNRIQDQGLEDKLFSDKKRKGILNDIIQEINNDNLRRSVEVGIEGVNKEIKAGRFTIKRK